MAAAAVALVAENVQCEEEAAPETAKASEVAVVYVPDPETARGHPTFQLVPFHWIVVCEFGPNVETHQLTVAPEVIPARAPEELV